MGDVKRKDYWKSTQHSPCICNVLFVEYVSHTMCVCLCVCKVRQRVCERERETTVATLATAKCFTLHIITREI